MRNFKIGDKVIYQSDTISIPGTIGIVVEANNINGSYRIKWNSIKGKYWYKQNSGIYKLTSEEETKYLKKIREKKLEKLLN